MGLVIWISLTVITILTIGGLSVYHALVGLTPARKEEARQIAAKRSKAENTFKEWDSFSPATQVMLGYSHLTPYVRWSKRDTTLKGVPVGYGNRLIGIRKGLHPVGLAQRWAEKDFKKLKEAIRKDHTDSSIVDMISNVKGVLDRDRLEQASEALSLDLSTIPEKEWKLIINKYNNTMIALRNKENKLNKALNTVAYENHRELKAWAYSADALKTLSTHDHKDVEDKEHSKWDEAFEKLQIEQRKVV